MSLLDLPMPLTDIESVLAWVDTFKLSRPTKKINRDFSDAVLLAEILSVHYPKLVEMHNYPPRNSHSLKLNNWMTLNRKVLKKLKLNLCSSTMDQLANSAPGLIERVLVMVREKIRRDEDVNKSLKEAEQNMSSGGSYYEACGDDENILVVPVKTRVNGVLESIQKKVVSYDSYLALKEELKDAKDSSDVLKQKVEHLDNLLKLKEERIEELQKQLERKQTRRKEVEALQNSLSIPFEPEPPSPNINDLVNVPSRPLSLKSVESTGKLCKEESRIPIPITEIKSMTKPSITEVTTKDYADDQMANVEKVKSDIFKEIEITDEKNSDGFQDTQDFDHETEAFVNIESTMQKEVREMSG
ncbi:sperm flagellar protein 1-like [Melitaea cinxia]|uniref:sperm flagellar protein 1-like n=1 Tax=Melitaea cinxia TaxID=113334 RepID=UPI001E270E9C|nr:sperm flagellar protein 1-like [Melitaea cinxia]